MYLRANVSLVDPRIIVHEFEHVRQFVMSEGPAEDLMQGPENPIANPFEGMAVEQEAIFADEIGLLF